MLALLNSGSMKIYSGTQPANPETALSGNTLLATATFSGTAYGTPALSGSAMVSQLQFTSTTVSPAASGTATFGRCLKSDGTTAVMDLTVGTDITLGNTSAQLGVNLVIQSAQIGMPCD